MKTYGNLAERRAHKIWKIPADKAVLYKPSPAALPAYSPFALYGSILNNCLEMSESYWSWLRGWRLEWRFEPNARNPYRPTGINHRL